MADRPRLYVLDAYSRIYQVHHAIRDGMTGPSGQPTHAVFGLFRDLLTLVHQTKPEYLIAAFEGQGGLALHRMTLLESYKANRGPMPDDLKLQMPVILRLFEGFGVPVLEADGYEADDVIATLARRGVEHGLDVTIMTADKDARQLLGPHVRILNLRDRKFLDVEALKADWGITPEQVVDYLSLTGDSVDNVPGVPGIGPKGATELLSTFGTLDGLLENIAKVSGAKRKENLHKHADDARRARSLVQLCQEVPIAIDWDALLYKGYDAKALRQLCAESGFHRFPDELGGGIKEEARPEVAWDTAAYAVIDDEIKLADLASRLRGLGRFGFDTETTSVDPHRAELVGMSFAWGAGEAAYLPIRGPAGSKLVDESAVIVALGPILADPNTELVGQNLKYDLQVLARLGVRTTEKLSDTMVLSYLLESGERNHGLDDLSRRLLDHTMIPISELIGKGKNQITMDQVAVERVAAYAGEDADAAWRLDSILAPKVLAEGMGGLYEDLERPLIGLLARMEAAGIKVDVARLRQLSEQFGAKLVDLEQAIYAEAGRPFQIGSLPQLRQILFEELKLPVVKKTPGGEPSTDVEVLEQLAAKHALPALLMQQRQFAKLKSTYLDALANLADEGGRIHASFHQTVAATGRLSSSDPNLQNIPIRTEDGGQIRQAFVAGAPDQVLLAADYSQIELRVLAHYTDDPALVKAFAEDRDIHAAVASRIFGVAEEQVTASQRRVAKTVNFGVVYGIKPFGLAARLGISQSDAAKFIESYFEEFRGVEAYFARTLDYARTHGHVQTILGRRRAISGVKDGNPRNLNLAERTAVNTVIQGSAADLMKRAMLDVDAGLQRAGLGSRILLQIHDELVLEVPRAELEQTARVVRKGMLGALKLSVPLGVDLSVGENWLDVRPIG